MWPFRKRRKAHAVLPDFFHGRYDAVPTMSRKQRRAHFLQNNLHARYDAAQTTTENVQHWAMADALSADAAMSPDVRRTLRNRARYEVANNTYAKGMILTIAGDCVGTGPRLQLLSEDGETNRIIEQAFAEWASTVDLAAKLRAMRMAKATDGETFAVLVNNPTLDHAIQLDLQPIEADRVTSPSESISKQTTVDGIEFDTFGNPVQYHVVMGDDSGLALPFGRFERLPASAMIHWFRTDRPGQHRGIPEITPALPLFAQLRRYTLAVLGAAETAADFAAVLYTDAPANGEAAAVEPMDIVALEKRMATVLPDGWRLGQIKSEHPNTAYTDFRREILGEIGRCLSLPVNIITGDSSRHNYASGRLDHQTYFKSICIEQSHLGHVVLDRVFTAWLAEAALLDRFAFLRRTDRLQWQWFFDGQSHVDPAKEARAQSVRLASNTTTLAYEYARQGRDWEAELRQRAKENALMKKLGLLPEEADKIKAQSLDKENKPDASLRPVT